MRIFIDMDGVLADFDRLVRETGENPDYLVEKYGTFRELQEIPGAREAVDELLASGFEVYIATRPAPSHPDTYSDKVRWVLTHFPELRKRVIMTQDKGLLGDKHDFLIDDRPHKANCVAFPGTLLHFGGDAPDVPLRRERYAWVRDWSQAIQALDLMSR